MICFVTLQAQYTVCASDPLATKPCCALESLACLTVVTVSFLYFSILVLELMRVLP